MTLAVVTQNPNAVAETYVRHHMREIAPGRTVAVALNGTAPPFEIPFLNLTRSTSNPLKAKARSPRLAAAIRICRGAHARPRSSARCLPRKA